MSSDDDVLAYLREAFSHDMEGVAAGARRELACLAEALRAHPAPDFARVAAWRLLASNSLGARREDGGEGDGGRRGWDRANDAIAALLGRADAPTFEMAVALHRALGVGPSLVRRDRIFSADEEYLAPARVHEAIGMLDAALARPEAGTIVGAFRAYVGVVTIHPFHNGNGRTARLLADAILLGGELLPVCFASPVSSHVARTKGGVPRDPRAAFEVFVGGVVNAYRVALRVA